MLMNKGWCSVTHSWLPDLPHRRGNGNGNAVVSCCSAPRPVSLSSSSPVAGFADRLQLGSLTDNDLSYTESFVIRAYEVGINETATIETIANMLQEVSTNHAVNMGSCNLGLITVLRKRNLICVIARMHIEMYKYPTWRDVVNIETWFTDEGRIGIRREYIIKDSATGLVFGRATSKWVLMNQDTRRFEKITPEINEEFMKFGARKSRLAFPGEKNNSKSLWKIPKLEDPAQHCRPRLLPRRTDLDMNQHVNNVTYIGWVLESMPQEVIDTHELRSITMDYRRECHHADLVDSLTTQESWDQGMEAIATVDATIDPDTTSQHDSHSRQFLHLLRLSGNCVEISRGRSQWRKNKP